MGDVVAGSDKVGMSFGMMVSCANGTCEWLSHTGGQFPQATLRGFANASSPIGLRWQCPLELRMRKSMT